MKIISSRNCFKKFVTKALSKNNFPFCYLHLQAIFDRSSSAKSSKCRRAFLWFCEFGLVKFDLNLKTKTESYSCSAPNHIPASLREALNFSLRRSNLLESTKRLPRRLDFFDPVRGKSLKKFSYGVESLLATTTGRKRLQKSFTLIELLLGLVIFSIISLTLYSVFSAGVRLNHGSAKQAQILREARWSLELMHKEIENMAAYDFSSSYPEKTALIGGNDKISFIKESTKGLEVISYYLVSGNDGYVHQEIIGSTYSKNVSVLLKNENAADTDYLIRKKTSLVDYLVDDSKLCEHEIIASNIKKGGLRFYYGYHDGELSDNISWGENWGSKYIPAMVRIEIDFNSGGKDKRILTLTKDVFIPAGEFGTMDEG